MQVKCTTCNGTYYTTGSDGLQYFHVCPPLSAVELAAAVAAAKVVLPVGETPDQAVLRRTYLRGQFRDENLVPGATGANAPIKTAGKGTTVVDVNPIPAPIVVT